MPLDVCAAVLQRADRYLLAQRPDGKHMSGKWEFPGGKVHEGESFAACIIREMDEELALVVRNPTFLTTVEHAYPEKTVRLHFMACEVDHVAQHEPREHLDVGWFTLPEIMAMDLAPADQRFVAWLNDQCDTCLPGSANRD